MAWGEAAIAFVAALFGAATGGTATWVLALLQWRRQRRANLYLNLVRSMTKAAVNVRDLDPAGHIETLRSAAELVELDALVAGGKDREVAVVLGEAVARMKDADRLNHLGHLRSLVEAVPELTTAYHQWLGLRLGAPKPMSPEWRGTRLDHWVRKTREALNP